MKRFMDDDFLLSTGTARMLFHDHAAKMPIFDYHCHLDPDEILENRSFSTVTELMLGGDHYKWRAMLSNGADEKLIYPGAGGGDYERFAAYAAMLKYAIGNPLYHWTHLELQRVFGISDILTERSARSVYDRCNEMLKGDEFRCRRLIERFNVKVICTTDDPASDLHAHIALAKDPSFRTRVLPSFRPDKALMVDGAGYGAYIEKLREVSDTDISSFEGLMAALEKRLDVFHALGARVSDHGPVRVPAGTLTDRQLDEVMARAIRGEAVSPEEGDAFRAAGLTRLGGMYASRGWVMQLHLNAMRNNCARMFKKYGPDTGFDSVGDGGRAWALSRLLDGIDEKYGLPKTILYSLNPTDNYIIGSMLGNFQGGVPGKVQMGSGWWFQDQRDGMAAQLRTLAALGLLGRFVGMLTDSRSFISYQRHEYFRRILCELIGSWVENGEYPADTETLAELVRGISYENAKAYFGIEVEG